MTDQHNREDPPRVSPRARVILDAADIDLVRREMVLHVLDANNAAAEVDAIRRDFEPPLLAWFGESA